MKGAIHPHVAFQQRLTNLPFFSVPNIFTYTVVWSHVEVKHHPSFYFLMT